MQSVENMLLEGFTLKNDLGFFGWDGYKSGYQYKEAAKMKKHEIINPIKYNCKPDKMINLEHARRQLPKQFYSNPRPQKYPNEYPYETPHIVPLYVACRDINVKMEDIDFVFGGSTLGVLAAGEINGEADKKYVLQKTHDIIWLSKSHPYTQDYSKRGYQFERFMTGKRFNDKHCPRIVQHLQIMDVFGYTILFCAESDALDSGKNLIEIKAGNPRWILEPKTIFQMISQGAKKISIC